MRTLSPFPTALAVFAAAFTSAGLVIAQDAPATPTNEDADGFVDLLNGQDLTGWITPPPTINWRYDKKSGELRRQAGGGYLWTEEAYGDFELHLDFKVTPGCNSGVFLRTDPNNAVQGGFEIQIMDSHRKGEDVGKHDCGAFYDAHAPLANPSRQAGQWNTMQISWMDGHLTVHINDVKVQDLNVDDWDTAGKNPDGSDNKFKTALADLPRTGHIGFQDHGHNVSYRNVRIRVAE